MLRRAEGGAGREGASRFGARRAAGRGVKRAGARRGAPPRVAQPPQRGEAEALHAAARAVRIHDVGDVAHLPGGGGRGGAGRGGGACVQGALRAGSLVVCPRAGPGAGAGAPTYRVQQRAQAPRARHRCERLAQRL